MEDDLHQNRRCEAASSILCCRCWEFTIHLTVVLEVKSESKRRRGCSSSRVVVVVGFWRGGSFALRLHSGSLISARRLERKTAFLPALLLPLRWEIREPCRKPRSTPQHFARKATLIHLSQQCHTSGCCCCHADCQRWTDSMSGQSAAAVGSNMWRWKHGFTDTKNPDDVQLLITDTNIKQYF